jgi:hypothetical protein
MDLDRGDTLPMVIASAIATTASLTMVLPYCYHHHLLKKPAHAVVFYLGVSNLFNSVSTIPGTPRDGTFACYLEATAASIFSLASFGWIMVMNYMMYNASSESYKEKFKIGPILHLAIWGFPTLITFLPLIDMDFGSDAPDSWCWIVPKDGVSNEIATFWYWFSYYAWLWCAIASSIGILLLIRWTSRNYLDHTRKVVNNRVNQLHFYPLVVIFCWALPCADDTILVAHDDMEIEQMYSDPRTGMATIGHISNTVPCLQGFLTAVVFWYTATEIRRKVFGGTSSIYPSSMAESSKRRPRSVVVVVNPSKKESFFNKDTTSSQQYKFISPSRIKHLPKQTEPNIQLSSAASGLSQV